MLQSPRAGKAVLGILLGFTAWCALYGTALVGTSLSSEQHLLGPSQEKRFCGFYLDCHLHAAVMRFDTAHTVGTGSQHVEAQGIFATITLRVSSDARREPTNFVGPRAVVRDALGREFPRSTAAERALSAAGAPGTPLTERVGAGASFLTTLVFDIPTDAQGLVLDVTDGYIVDRVIELFMIGDDDSLLHPRTLFRLTPS
jgi:hypothetical protein